MQFRSKIEQDSLPFSQKVVLVVYHNKSSLFSLYFITVFTCLVYPRFWKSISTKELNFCEANPFFVNFF